MTQTRPAKLLRPYRAVGPEVAVEVAALGEDLVTQLTDEALVEVLLHVHLEVRGHAEPLGAHGAHMRLLPPVTHHVVPAMANYLLFLYWRLIAQSTAQGHLRAFH